jgi:AraC-like DNA-binding protein
MDESIDYMVLSNTVSDLLPTGYPRIEAVALQLGVSTRSLQRRLQKLGITYSEVVKDVRCDKARNLLQTPEMSITRISKSLGYKDPSSFSRAFTRWNQVGPSCYRQTYVQKSKAETHRESQDSRCFP